MESTSLPDTQRPVIAVGLLAIGLIHVLDLPSKVRQLAGTPWAGFALCRRGGSCTRGPGLACRPPSGGALAASVAQRRN